MDADMAADRAETSSCSARFPSGSYSGPAMLKGAWRFLPPHVTAQLQLVLGVGAWLPSRHALQQAPQPGESDLTCLLCHATCQHMESTQHLTVQAHLDAGQRSIRTFFGSSSAASQAASQPPSQPSTPHSTPQKQPPAQHADTDTAQAQASPHKADQQPAEAPQPMTVGSEQAAPGMYSAAEASADRAPSHAEAGSDVEFEDVQPAGAPSQLPASPKGQQPSDQQKLASEHLQDPPGGGGGKKRVLSLPPAPRLSPSLPTRSTR